MTVRVSTAVRNAMVDAARVLPDAGSGAGKLRIYTGSQPGGGPGVAATGTLLVEIPLADPATDAVAAGGTATFDVTPEPTALAVATGTAGWARLLDSNNVAIADNSIGGAGGLVLSDTAVVSGAAVTINALALTVAASA